MRRKCIFFIFMLTFSSCGDYNTGLEIKLTDYADFNGYEMQYNDNKYDDDNWKPLPIHNEETIGNTRYIASGLMFEDYYAYFNKQIYFRFVNKELSRISEIHSFAGKSKSTYFFKLFMSDGIPSENNPCTMPMSYTSLPCHSMSFRTKHFVLPDDPPYLLLPLNFLITTMSSILFSWHCSEEYSLDGNYTKTLIIGKNDTIVENINVGSNNSFYWDISNGNLSYGNYWWQFVVTSNSYHVVGSERRFFTLIENENLTDTDDDGYIDNDELARGSDPNDPNDIPLIITSDENFPNGYLGQQYFLVPKVNDAKYRCSWDLIGSLPDGLTLSESGTISGVPQKTGYFTFRLKVTNQKWKQDIKRFFINISDPPKSSVRVGNGYVR